MRRIFQTITEIGLLIGFFGIVCLGLEYEYEQPGILLVYLGIPIMLLGLAGEILILASKGGCD